MISAAHDLLHAILHDPDNDDLRLRFADAIEDDEPARAEFVRVQIALAKCHCRVHGYECNAARCFSLQSRERELTFVDGKPRQHSEWFDLPKGFICKLAGFSCDGLNQFAIVSRGFISAITLPRSALPQLASILAAHPIEKITVEGLEFHICPRADSNWWDVRVVPNNSMVAVDATWLARADMCEKVATYIEAMLPRNEFQSDQTFRRYYMNHGITVMEPRAFILPPE